MPVCWRPTGCSAAPITLINPRPEFVERIRLHQLAAANHTAAALRRRLGPGVRLVMDAAERIDAGPANPVGLRRPGRLRLSDLRGGVSTGACPNSPIGLSELGRAAAADQLAELPPGAPDRRGRRRPDRHRDRWPNSLAGPHGQPGRHARASLAPSGRRSVAATTRSTGSTSSAPSRSAPSPAAT